jgi:parvulin-like peptidyl-prolyl isomerase
MRASHILVNYLYEAQDLIKALSEGKSFEALARRYSLCNSAQQGGWLGDLSNNKVDHDFLAALSSLKINQVSPPIRSKFGYHLIKREED